MSDPRIDLLDQAAPRADINRLLARLDSTEVVVRAVPGQAATALSIVNLLARLIPNVQIDAPAIEVEVSPFGVGSMSRNMAKTPDIKTARTTAGSRPGARPKGGLTARSSCASNSGGSQLGGSSWKYRLGLSAASGNVATRPAFSGPDD